MLAAFVGIVRGDWLGLAETARCEIDPGQFGSLLEKFRHREGAFSRKIEIHRGSTLRIGVPGDLHLGARELRQHEVLCRVTARVLRIMSLRMAQGMVVPDMLEDLFDTVPRTIDGLGQYNFVFTCKPDGNGRWIAEVPDVLLAKCDGATQEEALRRIKSLVLWMLAAVAEEPRSDLPLPMCLRFQVATGTTIDVGRQ